MADPRFFKRYGPFSIFDLASIAGATPEDGADLEREIVDVAPLDTASPKELSFLDNRKYLRALRETRAGAVFVHPDFANDAPEGTAALISANPLKAYALAAQAFYPREAPAGRIDPDAHIDETAEVGTDCVVMAGAYVGAGAKLGARCTIGPNAVIGDAVEVGDDTRIGACASLTHCLVGAGCDIYPGARIGQRGFGFAIDPKGPVRIPQVGRVIIEDDVEVGSNSTIDRGATRDTIIRRGTRIDNLVQVAHNVEVGPGCVIVAQTGIAGSVTLEQGVVLAGQAGINGHVRIGAGAQVAAQAGILRDVEPGEKMWGSPAVPLKERMRQVAAMGKMGKTRVWRRKKSDVEQGE